jgi:uncharacterized membrane protein YeiH
MFPTTLIKFIPFIEAIGIIAFCISGFIRAQQHRFDPIGVFIIGFVTAFGGGTLRDIMLDRRPFFWVEHEAYIIALFVFSLVAGKTLHFMQRVFSLKSMLVADALGLSLFTITSTAVALDAGMPYFVASMYGVMGATFGGVIRDILCNEKPLLLIDAEPYATCAFAGSWLYLALMYFNVQAFLSLALGSVLVFVLRMASIKLKWRVPSGF